VGRAVPALPVRRPFEILSREDLFSCDRRQCRDAMDEVVVDNPPSERRPRRCPTGGGATVWQERISTRDSRPQGAFTTMVRLAPQLFASNPVRPDMTAVRRTR